MARRSMSRRGLGVDAGLDPGLARDLAARCQELGFDSLWSNDDPGAPGLETLAHFAAGAPALELGVGVLPLQRYEPAGIAREVDRLGLDPARLWLGIGSGSLPRQLGPVRSAVAELRDMLPEARIVIAAMRPRLCRLGGAIADGVLLNWMLPDGAARAREWVREGAAEAGRDAPVVASYVRVAVGPGAQTRLDAVEGRYRTLTPGQARHFAAMDVPLGSVGVATATGAEAREALAAYEPALDLTIARVLAQPEAAALAAVADAAAPDR
jgi:alkanesulfonate monooxygenase SsuD/methylene tetrahydromethanopterin reductase-like flavin-dependent oxidoreductase (luciferase family)